MIVLQILIILSILNVSNLNYFCNGINQSFLSIKFHHTNPNNQKMDMENIDVRLGKIDGRETEWTQVQRKHGNLPELPEEKKEEIYQPTKEELIHNQLSGKTLNQLEEFEDDFDEEILLQYKNERLKQIQQNNQSTKHGKVREINATEWKEEVTNDKGPYICIHLYASGNPGCDKVDDIFVQLSKKHSAVKFLRIKGTNAIRNFPEKNCPTILVYKDGELATQFGSFGTSTTIEKIEWEMAKQGIVTTTLKEDPVKKKKEDTLSKGWEKRKGYESD